MLNKYFFLHFQIELLISTLVVVLTIVKSSAAGILTPNALFTNIDQNQFSNNENTDNSGYLVRNKRSAYIIPSDYYSNYYNDYYNNYYNRPISGQNYADRYDNYNNRPSGGQNIITPVRPSADRFDGDDDDNNFVVSQGTKYVYTPIFKYKSTQQKRHKLFVPNLFG